MCCQMKHKIYYITVTYVLVLIYIYIFMYVCTYVCMHKYFLYTINWIELNWIEWSIHLNVQLSEFNWQWDMNTMNVCCRHLDRVYHIKPQFSFFFFWFSFCFCISLFLFVFYLFCTYNYYVHHSNDKNYTCI